MDSNLNIAPHVVRLTVNIDDEDAPLFEGTWPIPEGVALHAYLVLGTKTVLIDPWDAGGYGPEEIEADLTELGLGWSQVDAVAFTKEPAPSVLKRLRAVHPTLESWGTAVHPVVHDLGKGLKLEAQQGFWTLPGASVLFSGDAFSGLGWMDEEVWYEDLKGDAARYFDDEALRWFSSRPLAPAALPRGFTIVAPAHGCLFRNADAAVARAQKFSGWASGDALDEVTVVWPAADDAGAQALVGGALDVGVGLNLLRVPGDHLSALAAAARRASLVVVAEGLDLDFLKGLEKDLWRPAVGVAPEALRKGLCDRYET